MASLVLTEVVTGYGSGPDILKGVSIDVEAGRTYCVIGPNGAGKSTMLKAIAGLLSPRSGSITFNGIDIGGRRPDQILAEGICLVPQDRAVFPEMSVRENMIIGGYLVRDKSVLQSRLDAALDLLPALQPRLDQMAQTLSGGEQQMLALGRSLMIEPKLMMVDEPSLGLAPRMADTIFDAIRRLSRELGVTIVMVEQNVKRGLALADHAFVLDMGKQNFEGPPDEVLADPRIRSLYLGSMAGSQEGGSDD